MRAERDTLCKARETATLGRSEGAGVGVSPVDSDIMTSLPRQLTLRTNEGTGHNPPSSISLTGIATI
jgi:hypothetical protein